MKSGLKKLLTQELERKQIALFNRGHQGRKNSRRYIQLIDAQDELTRRPGETPPPAKGAQRMTAQIDMFKKSEQHQQRFFALLELHEEKAYTAEELLEELEPYTGKLDLNQTIPAQVAYLVPNSIFFFMDVTDAVTSP